VLSFWDKRGAVNEAFLREIHKSFPDKIFESKIRRDMTVSRAVLKGKTVFDVDNESHASLDYQFLAKEFLKRSSTNHNFKAVCMGFENV